MIPKQKKRSLPPPAPKGNKRALGCTTSGAPLIYSEEWLKEEAKLFRDWMYREDAIYFKSFAIERGYSPQRFSEFAEKSPEFSEALRFAKDWQEQKLISYGLFNKTNSNMTKFVLSNCHGMVEKTQVSGDASNPISCLLTSVDGKTKDLCEDKGADRD